MENEASYLERLAECDEKNLNQSKHVLVKLHPKSLEIADECAKLFEEVSLRFGDRCGYDKYNHQVNEWLKQQGGNPEETAKLLQTAVLIGQGPGDDPVLKAKTDLQKAYSVIARCILLLRLGRDYLFGLTDLLRLRLASLFGYLRLQTESVAILMLMAKDSDIAADWLNLEGKEFYGKYHRRRIVQEIKDIDLYQYYEEGSNIALHSRVLGVAAGIAVGNKSTGRGQILLTYQDIDDSVDLFSWFCIYLRAHERMIQKLQRAVPEIDFPEDKLGSFSQNVESLWLKRGSLYRQKQNAASR
jgi:hypothetical protein